MEQEDGTNLKAIAAALGRVGSELDAADRVRGHSPWGEIARQEKRIGCLAKRLSGGFCRAHPDLVRRLAACTSLHLAWGSLLDEVERAICEETAPGVTAQALEARTGEGSKG